MRKIKIYVEGVADAKLIQDLILEIYQMKMIFDKSGKYGEPNILITNGKTNLDKFKPQFKINSENDILSIVIFDADIFNDENDKFIALKKEFPIEYFLLPDNKSNGDLETLLAQIINQDNKVIFKCWEGYENCLKTSTRKEGIFTTPARKTKIYAYLEALLGESNSEKDLIKERERNYQNQNHWDLNAPALVNLKLFLDQYFQKLS